MAIERGGGWFVARGSENHVAAAQLFEPRATSYGPRLTGIKLVVRASLDRPKNGSLYGREGIMLKTVVVFQTVVVGSVSVLLALMSQPPARAQVTASVAIPSQPAAPASTPTDVQHFRGSGSPFSVSDSSDTDATADAAATDAAGQRPQSPGKQAQSKIDCTFALKMMEVDPNVDSRIRVGTPDGGRARIRRILPPACLK